MILKLILFILCSTSFMHIFDVSFDFGNLKNIRIKPKEKKTKITAKAYVQELEGKDKRNYLQRNTDDTKEALARSGRSSKFKKTMLLAKTMSVAGFFIGLSLRSVLLTPVLAIGLYFIPLWTSRLYVYRYNKIVSEELETALSLITSSYTRHNDFQKAVEENIEHIKNPVANTFRQFLQNVKFISADISGEIEKIQSKIDNKIFFKWCDTIIQCQSDHTLKSTLVPIVNKFSDLKMQQVENETNMLKPLKTTASMVTLVLSSPIILLLFNKDWFNNLMFTFWGQFALSFTVIIIFITINKAILLCEPIEYDI